MNEGDGMAKVTEADRQKAAGLRALARIDHDWQFAEPAIAAALAEEREKARAPFLALADRWADDQRAHKNYWVRGDAAANAIRYKAEDIGWTA